MNAFAIGIVVDFVPSLVVRVIVYMYLARNWDGYRDHNYLRSLHTATYIILTIIPYFDLILINGYI